MESPPQGNPDSEASPDKAGIVHCLGISGQAIGEAIYDTPHQKKATGHEVEYVTGNSAETKGAELDAPAGAE